MTAWIRPILCYVSPTGRNKIADWYRGLSIQERADADEFIKNVRRLRKWGFPEYRMLRNTNGLGELRWQSEKKQQRLIGYSVGESWYAVIGCNHKGTRYIPSDALETAKARKKQLEQGHAGTVAYDL